MLSAVIFRSGWADKSDVFCISALEALGLCCIH